MKHYRSFRFNSSPNSDPATPTAQPEARAFKYRAFLSYSHRDSTWAKWLHKALEAYRIDKDLVGRETPAGPVPKALRPIFRDRDDFSAGHSLSGQTLAALEASQFLVVICSPNAAQSAYVNEEIRQFKTMGGAARVIPVIIDGEPGDPQRECFTPALRFKLSADGSLTGEREEPIAADARPQGDGKEIAKQKIVAGLLGVGFDEIIRRAERARRRRNRLRFGLIGAAALIVASAVLGWVGFESFYEQLRVAEDLNSASDTADACERADSMNVSDQWRIALALECVDTFRQVLGGLPQDARLPERVVSLFRANVAILQKLKDQGKLTPQQLAVLANAQALEARLNRS